jgi:hypothetical protein
MVQKIDYAIPHYRRFHKQLPAVQFGEWKAGAVFEAGPFRLFDKVESYTVVSGQ